jgi:wyosine [tRNA(Phe)-imidazoG37] synthetase (radical SAM superfamily)
LKMHREYEKSRQIENAWRNHERRWRDNRYAYAVVSRRRGGISIGINLNPDLSCNFRCVYCQVDRSMPEKGAKVDLDRVAEEIGTILEAERSGSLYESAPFDSLPAQERGVRDIAFSGNGEPTAFPRFGEAAEIAVQSRARFSLDAAKITLITNAAYLHKPPVQSALALLDQNNGEIWAKLDAGTESFFRKVNRSNVPFQRILDNILQSGRVRPVVIQSLWFQYRGERPAAEEIGAYCRRINELIAAGAQFRSIQLYTIAREPGEIGAAPLPRNALDRIAVTIQSSVKVPIEIYYGF